MQGNGICRHWRLGVGLPQVSNRGSSASIAPSFCRAQRTRRRSSCNILWTFRRPLSLLKKIGNRRKGSNCASQRDKTMERFVLSQTKQWNLFSFSTEVRPPPTPPPKRKKEKREDHNRTIPFFYISRQYNYELISPR